MFLVLKVVSYNVVARVTNVQLQGGMSNIHLKQCFEKGNLPKYLAKRHKNLQQIKINISSFTQ